MNARRGRPSLPAKEALRVREALRQLLVEKYGDNRARLGRDLKISGQAVGKLVAGESTASIDVVAKLAHLLHTTEWALRRGSSEAGFEALDIALAYWPNRWSDHVVEEARRLASRGEKYAPPGWTARLDELAEKRPPARVAHLRPKDKLD